MEKLPQKSQKMRYKLVKTSKNIVFFKEKAGTVENLRQKCNKRKSNDTKVTYFF